MTDNVQPTPRDPLDALLDRHRIRFGNTVSFAGIAAAVPGEVVALLNTALSSGKPTSSGAIRLALGMNAEPPGPDAGPLAVAIDTYRGRFAMTPWATNPPPREDLAALNWLLMVYQNRVGSRPAVEQFLTWPPALTNALLTAVERGEKLTADDVFRCLGMVPPPSPAVAGG